MASGQRPMAAVEAVHRLAGRDQADDGQKAVVPAGADFAVQALWPRLDRPGGAGSKAFGLGLALLALGRSPASISAVAEIEAETADQSRRRDNQKASGAGGVCCGRWHCRRDRRRSGGCASAPRTDCTPTDRPDLAAIPADGFPWLELLLWGVLAAALVAAAYFLWRAHGQKMRVTALRSLANSQKGQT